MDVIFEGIAVGFDSLIRVSGTKLMPLADATYHSNKRVRIGGVAGDR